MRAGGERAGKNARSSCVREGKIGKKKKGDYGGFGPFFHGMKLFYQTSENKQLSFTNEFVGQANNKKRTASIL